MFYNVKNFGATGDGITMDTAAVQSAINACSNSGGGTVLLEEGVFLIGTIQLFSGVELHIDASATLLGSKDINNYPEIKGTVWNDEYSPRNNSRCLIYAENCKNIAITGRGTIDCNGDTYVERRPDEDCFYDDGERQFIWYYQRKDVITPPRVVMIFKSEDITFRDVVMQNQPSGWSYWVCGCKNVKFDSLTIRSNVEYPNNDGLDIFNCKNVTVTGCNIQTGDDCIAVRSYSLPLGENTACEGVTVTNCNLTSHTSAIRLGWLGDGEIKNCTFSNITVTDSTAGIEIRIPKGDPSGQRYSDQGDEQTKIENIIFSNITINNSFYAPIQFSIAPNNFKSCEYIRNIQLNNIIANGHFLPTFVGAKDCPFENITLNNCRFEQIPWKHVKEMEEDLGDGPIHMLTVENVKNLTLNNTVIISADDISD